MNFSDELIEKAKSAKTPEELITMAKAENIELTNEQASEYFAMLHQKSGEISDEELENVSGGACYYQKDGRMVVTIALTCDFYKCCICGRVGKKEIKDMYTHAGKTITCVCGNTLHCGGCAHAKVHKGFLLCDEPHNQRDYKG